MAAFVSFFAGVPLRHAQTSASVSPAVTHRSVVRMAKSEAIPFLEAQPNLNKDHPGYCGFDPVGLSNYLDQDWAEAGEIKNGRVAMLACLGMLVQEFVHLPGGAAFSESNPIKAIYAVPVEGWIQILLAISLVELATFRKTYKSGADLEFDPMGMGAKDSSMRLKEVKNGRLAMLGAIGMIFQTMVFGEGPVAQLSHLGSVYTANIPN